MIEYEQIGKELDDLIINKINTTNDESFTKFALETLAKAEDKIES